MVGWTSWWGLHWPPLSSPSGSMVIPLGRPARPLKGGHVHEWEPHTTQFRIYHLDDRTPNGITFRDFGPILRFDHHEPSSGPRLDPSGRAVLYFASSLGTAGAEVFGDRREALICPSYRVVRAQPKITANLQELVGPGLMQIGALASLGSGDVGYDLSQEWARAIYEDSPACPDVTGVHYQSAHDSLETLALWERSEPPGYGPGDDLAIIDSVVWPSFLVEMQRRAINVTRVDSASCSKCTDAARRSKP